MDIGERLRAARERRGMTQADLAEKLGVSPVTVTLWENRRHRRMIGTKHLANVAVALEIRVSELLGETDPAGQPAPGSATTTTMDLAETQLLRLFRLMSEEVKLFQLAQFVECASGAKLDHARGYEPRQSGPAALSPENSESR